VLDDIYQMFLDLDASDEQIEFPVLYSMGRGAIIVHAERLRNLADGFKIRNYLLIYIRGFFTYFFGTNRTPQPFCMAKLPEKRRNQYIH
jgi:hypothetical protein